MRIQELLLRPGQRKLETGFGWERVEAEPHAAVYDPANLDELSDHDIDGVVIQPEDIEFMNSLPVRFVSSGSYGSVYELDDTGVLVKKHYPDTYVGGYEGQDIFGKTYARRISGSSILEGLAINISLERALRGYEGYTTPKYLAHLMLMNEEEVIRHYTLMTKLKVAEPESEAEKQRIAELKQNAVGAAKDALRRGHYATKFIDWDIEHPDGYNNVIPTRNHLGEIVLGIIDQRSWFSKGKRLPNAPLIPRRYHDPSAPWLAVSNAILHDQTQPSPKR